MYKNPLDDRDWDNIPEPDAPPDGTALTWHPITEAPKYVRVLVYADGVVRIACCVNGHDHWTADEGYTVEPTHWQPLPSPPRVSRAGAEPAS